jgi:steroid delta-isomerase-like uncharacterized protein
MADTETAAPKTERPKRQTAKQVEKTLRDYFAAAGRRNLDEMFAFYDSDVILDLVPIGVRRGAREYRAFFEEVFGAVPDAEFTVVRVTANSSAGAVEWRCSGTFNGTRSFQGVEPNGRHIELRGCDVFEVKDGKIVKNTAFYDGMAFARGVGMMPPQDSGAERAMKQAFNAVSKVRKAVQERR